MSKVVYKNKHHSTFKGGVRESVKRYENKNIEKRKVWTELNIAVKYGEVVKGACVVCGSKNVVGHHDDYTKPLEVTWLCRKHHVHLHKGLISI